MSIHPSYPNHPFKVGLHRRFTVKEQLAPKTLYNYGFDWLVFTRWCEVEGRDALPATTETVEAFAAHVIGRGQKVSTALRRYAAIRHYHRQARAADPVTSQSYAILAAARRERMETTAQKSPVRIDDLRRICDALPATRRGVRDRAVLLLGFCSALRQSNIAALNFDDLTFSAQGLRVQVRKEKQDQEAKGRAIGIPRGTTLCAVEALERWIEHRGTTNGPLFSNIRAPRGRIASRAVAEIVKRYIAQLPGRTRAEVGGHSLRAGFVTESLDAGISEILIARQTGHKRLDTLRLYYRSRDLFRGNACGMLGL